MHKDGKLVTVCGHIQWRERGKVANQTGTTQCNEQEETETEIEIEIENNTHAHTAICHTESF